VEAVAVGVETLAEHQAELAELAVAVPEAWLELLTQVAVEVLAMLTLLDLLVAQVS
jgi:hypothetical protein